ncbi:hypothetical protein MATL_G00185950 [Megalops atlanticus]|uniref:Shootin-1 n=1 Tax=Megalops atlanticus TaxID=7932 RepID=A0A9D3PMR8_MEGAT|nr:hypothetical protein MATL_G00185950 [Megalops atlanticus]
MESVEEAKQMEIITELSKQAVHEYQGLQEEHEKTKMECESAQKERDSAVKKLKEFQRVSEMVIEEVSLIQESLEIEKSCRQSAEALASKLNRQNRSLKRKSMLYLSRLGPEVIAEINTEDEDEETSVESEQGTETCSSTHCQKIITELRDKLTLVLDEKRQTAIELAEAKEGLKTTREELLKEKHHNTTLIAEAIQQKKLLAKYNRVSLLALEEYEVLQENLELEKDLRAEAEKFAREMLVEQKKLNRQSQILLQNVSPSGALQEALSDVARLTQALETQKLEHQKQMKEIQEQLQSSELRKEVEALRRQVELLEEEKKECEDRCAKAEVAAKDMRFTVDELQKKLQLAVNPPSAPPPPPPPAPPPPPPPAPSASNPLSSLLSMMRKKKQANNDIPLVVQDSPEKDAETKMSNVRQQAVEEMMDRIKKGVQLRRVNHASSRTKQLQKEKMPPNSAVQELKGILDTFKRPTPAQHKAGTPVGSSETELERVLQRRRCAFDTTQDNRSQPSVDPFPSSVLDLTRVKGTQPSSKEPSGAEMGPSEPTADKLNGAPTEVDSTGKEDETNGGT